MSAAKQLPFEPVSGDSALKRLDQELWLRERLLRHGVDPFEGDTTTEGRAKLFAKSIIENGLACVVCGRRDGRPMDYGGMFERIYDKSLLDVSRGTISKNW